MIRNTCLFENFGQKAYNNNPVVTEGSKDYYSNFRTAIFQDYIRENDNVVLFGSYCLGIVHDVIDFTDFSQCSGESVTTHVEILDNWSYTIQNIYERYNNKNVVFVLNDEYLSALVDPRPLFLSIKKLFLFSAGSVRFLLVSSEGHNISLRKWDSDGIELFLKSSGFTYSIQSLGASGRIFDCSIDKQSYTEYFINNNIQPTLVDSHYLLLTTEDADVKPTGGIGTYVKNLKKMNDKIVVLYCCIDHPDVSSYPNVIFVNKFIRYIDYDQFMDGMGLIEVLKCMLYLFPNISIVEYQDFLALGYRIVQAKKTGILPQYIRTKVFLHGGIDYVKYGIQNDTAMNYSFQELCLSVKEMYVTKHSDIVVAPSAYIANKLLKEEFGYDIPHLTFVKHPFDLDLIKKTKTVFGKAQRLVYIGKYMTLKGWSDFVEAIRILHKQNVYLPKEIVAIAPGAPSAEDLSFLTSVAKFSRHHFTHADFLTYIQQYKNDSLFVVPSRGESFSFVALELMLSGALFIGYRAGGVVEVVDDASYLDSFFSNPNPASLAEKIQTVLNSDPLQTTDAINKFNDICWERQAKVNQYWRDELSRRDVSFSTFKFDKNIGSNISVVVPVYNTKLSYLDDLLLSIKSSRIQPSEVIFVDDGSTEDYSVEFNGFIKEKLNWGLKYRVCRQLNAGLAGARNSGLKESKTDYTMMIDSDDMLYVDTLSNYYVALNTSPELSVVTGFAVYFKEYSDVMQNSDPIKYGHFWKPLGIPEARALSMYQNQYMTANCMINTKRVIEFGGWDDSDRSTWEDWAFYTRLAWSNKNFSLIPTNGFLYRNTPGSMSKTYNRYFGRRRIIRNIGFLSKIDSNVFMSLMNNSNVNTDLFQLNDLEVKIIKLKRKLEKRRFAKKVFIFLVEIVKKTKLIKL